MVLDIVIQFGKFFSESSKSDTNWLDGFLKYFVAPFLSFLSALALYYWKESADKKKEEAKKKKMSDNDLEYFETVVSSVLDDIPTQIEAYQKFAECIKAEPSKSHELTVVMIENLNRILNKYDQQKIFHSYISQFKGDQITTATVYFMEIYKLLDLYLKSYHDAIDINIRLNLEIEKRLNTDYVGMFRTNFIPKFENFYEAVKASNNIELLSFIRTVRDNFNNQEERIVQITQEYFIDKLLAEYEAIKQYPTGEELLFDCQVIDSIYDNVVRNSIFLADKILELSEGVEGIVENIKIIDNETDLLLKSKM